MGKAGEGTRPQGGTVKGAAYNVSSSAKPKHTGQQGPVAGPGAGSLTVGTQTPTRGGKKMGR